MQSPLSKRLFVRAIIESGPGLFSGRTLVGNTTLAAAEQAGVKYAESKGAHSLAELRALPSRELAALDAPARPITDGWVLPENNRRVSEVPVINGMTADDIGIPGGGARTPVTVGSYQSDSKKNFGAEADTFLELYPATADSDVPQQRKISARARARVSINLWAADQMKLSPRVYTYYFSRPIPWPQHPEFGAFHGAELPYVFNNLKTLDRPWQPADRTLADQMSSYWVNFAKTGNPNGKGLPVWAPVDKNSHATMELGAHAGPMPLADSARLAFWREFLAKP